MNVNELDGWYHCDGKSTDIHSLDYETDIPLAPIAILQRYPGVTDDWFHLINTISDDPINISIYEPKYIDEVHGSLSERDKKTLMEIFNNGGWEKLREAFNQGCIDMCDEDTDCEACLRRRNNFPATPPDYTQLPD